MNLVKAFAVGAAIVYVGEKIGESSTIQSMSPTIANYGNYIGGGLVLLTVKHFNLL